MGFQIVTIVIGVLLLILSIVSLCQHGYTQTIYNNNYSYTRVYDSDDATHRTYINDPESKYLTVS